VKSIDFYGQCDYDPTGPAEVRAPRAILLRRLFGDGAEGWKLRTGNTHTEGDKPASLGVHLVQRLMEDMTMKPEDVLIITRSIRSQKTGLLLPRQGIFVSAIENLRLPANPGQL
jgi:hypothetical protein